MICNADTGYTLNSDVNKDLSDKAKAKVSGHKAKDKAKDSTCKAKAKDLQKVSKAKAKDLHYLSKDKAKDCALLITKDKVFTMKIDLKWLLLIHAKSN